VHGGVEYKGGFTLHLHIDGSIVGVVSSSVWVEAHTCVLPIMCWVGCILYPEYWSDVTICNLRYSKSSYSCFQIVHSITLWKWCHWGPKVPRNGGSLRPFIMMSLDEGRLARNLQEKWLSCSKTKALWTILMAYNYSGERRRGWEWHHYYGTCITHHHLAQAQKQ